MSLICMFLLILAGCGGFEQDKLRKADIALQDAAGKTIVAYGMDRKEVEKTLGDGTMNNEAKMIVYQEGKVSIWYRGTKVVGFICSNPEYSTPRGIRLGMTAMEVRNAYGTKSMSRLESSMTEGYKTFYYAYDTERRIPLGAEKPTYNENQLKKQFSISFLLDGDGYVQNFSASDNLIGFFLR